MKKELLLSATLSFMFFLIGFMLLHYGHIEYGFAFFSLLPFIVGYVFGKTHSKKLSLYGLAISLVLMCVLLLTTGMDGMICVFMALPLIVFGVLFGFFTRRSFSKNTKQNSQSSNLLKSSVLPFLFFIGVGLLEKTVSADGPEIIDVKTEMILLNTPMEVYETIKSVDTLVGEKPFLMKLDLPVPVKCVLEKEEVGGIRTCYFTGGTITERITELEKGKILKMDVIDYQLTGRKWLGFKEAIYLFEPAGENSCKLTRITTYTSELKPRFYWEPLEKWGIRQEHDYVFANLKNDLKK